MLPLVGMVPLLGKAAKAIFEFALIGVTIPIGLIVIAGAWLYFDRSSAIRDAVDRAVTELVAGAELEAARQRNVALLQIVEEQRRRAEAAGRARDEFERAKAEAEAKIGDLADEIAELESRPVAADCRVDPAILDRLHNR